MKDEIGIGENHDGIMVLSDNYNAGDLAKTVFEVNEDTIFEIGLTPTELMPCRTMGWPETLWLL